MYSKLVYYSILYFSILFFSHNVNAANKQVQESISVRSTHRAKETVNIYAPVSFTSEGVNGFLKSIYNHTDYSKEVLPNSFSHFLQFLEYGKKTKQKDHFIKS